MLYITFMGGPRFLLDGADVSDQISSKAAAIIAPGPDEGDPANAPQRHHQLSLERKQR